MKSTLTTLSFLLALMAVSPTHSTVKRTYSDVLMLRLGDGYLTYDRISVGESALRMDETKAVYSNMQSTLNLTQTVDHDELAKDLNVDVSASGGWGSFSANASANYLRHVEDNRHTENFTFSERYYVNALLDFSKLPTDSNAFHDGAANVYARDIRKFTNHYGDTFIVQLPMGAFLIANLQLSFASAIDKERFDASLGGGFGSIFNASATIKNAVEKSKSTGTIEISAYQRGGDPTELPKIFAKKEGGGYYVTSCALNNLKDCQSAIDGVIRYAQTNFNKQIQQNSVGAKPLGNLVAVGEPSLATYASKFNTQTATSLDQTIVKSRLEMATLYNTTKNTKTFFDHFLTSPAANYFTPGANELLKNIQANLDWNWSLFDQFGAIYCYMPGEEARCTEILANIKQYSKPINEEVIRYYMNNGYFETPSNCSFIPVGLPQDINQIYAAYRFGQWLNGIFIFDLSPNKSRLAINFDYISPLNGHHRQIMGNLSPQGSFLNYSGKTKLHDLTSESWNEMVRSVRITKNNV